MNQRNLARAAGAMLLSLTLPAPAQEDAPAADWTQKPVPALPAVLGAKSRLLSLAQAGDLLVAVGEEGLILRSSDGVTWEQQPSPASEMLTRVRFVDAQHGWITGYAATILATEDGGHRWTLRHFDPKARPLHDILFLDSQHGIAVGGFGSYLTTADGGQTWSAASSPLTELGLHFNTIQRLDDGSLFVAGEKGLTARSTDGGANWTLLKSPYAGSFFGAMPLGGRKILVYGMRGNVFVVDDLAACKPQDKTWDPETAQTLTDAAQIAKIGWRRVDGALRESVFGALREKSGEILLVGINGAAVETHLSDSKLVSMKVPAEEALTDVRDFKGRLIAVGKRGVQDLGEAR